MIQDFMAVLAQEECRDLWLKYETRNLIEDLLQEIIMLKGMDRFYYVKRLEQGFETYLYLLFCIAAKMH